MGKTIARITALALGAVSAAGASSVLAGDELCATAEQAAEVQEFYSGNPGVLPLIAVRNLDMTEAAIASALSADQAVGVSAEAFDDVWSRASQLEWAMTLVMKEGHVFEIFGPVQSGEHSTRSSYFNLAGDDHFGAHLRPDLLSAIYAFKIPNQEGGTLLGVSFFGKGGETDFSLVLNAEGHTPSEADMATFDELVSFIGSQPIFCGQ